MFLNLIETVFTSYVKVIQVEHWFMSWTAQGLPIFPSELVAQMSSFKFAFQQDYLVIAYNQETMLHVLKIVDSRLRNRKWYLNR